jgi:enoyl-CoA hydratase/carnithine racemase
MAINRKESTILDTVVVDNVSLGSDGGSVSVLWLNRPDSLNAMSSAMIRALDAALRSADIDDQVVAVLITGRGRAFSAGGDLKAYIEMQKDAVKFRTFLTELHATFASIKTMQKPVVALVNGPTAAGGLELMLACDFAYAAASAQIGDAHLNFGQMGGGGSLALLPRAIGPARARELLFSARLLSAQESLNWGLVNRVVPDDKLLEAGIDFARGVASKSAAAVASAKYVLNVGWAEGTGQEAALRLECERAVSYCCTLPDSMEGLLAFAEKRTPKFRTFRPSVPSNGKVVGHESD